MLCFACGDLSSQGAEQRFLQIPHLSGKTGKTQTAALAAATAT